MNPQVFEVEVSLFQVSRDFLLSGMRDLQNTWLARSDGQWSALANFFLISGLWFVRLIFFICPEFSPLIRFLVSGRSRRKPGNNNGFLGLLYRLSLGWVWAKADQLLFIQNLCIAAYCVC
jgi:hypothetical protein